MSVKVMSLVWEAEGLSPTHRLILLSLADHANDEGMCYPSTGRLAKRTGLSERAVQGAVAALQDAGWLRVERNAGPRGCNLFTICIPAADAPPQQMHPRSKCATPRSKCAPTPAAGAPEPSKNHQETSVSRIRARDEVREVLEEVATPAAVTSFLAYRRKSKAGALTPTGAKRLAASLREIFDSGGDTDDALAMAEERGWRSIKPDWYFKEQANGQSHHNGRNDPALRAIAAAARAF